MAQHSPLGSSLLNNLPSQAGGGLWESIQDPCGIFALDYKVLWANRTMALLHRCSPRKIVGTICYQSLMGLDEPCHNCPVEVVIQTGKIHISERWMDFPNGQRRWGEVHCYPIRENDTIIAIATIIFEVTKQKQEVQKLKKYSSFLAKRLTEQADPKKELKIGQKTTLQAAFTPREREILRLVTEGHSNVDIATLLAISPNTVKTHVNSIFNKLGVSDRTQAAVIATRLHLI